MVYGRKQASIRAQCSHASVGLAQARPNYSGNYAGIIATSIAVSAIWLLCHKIVTAALCICLCVQQICDIHSTSVSTLTPLHIESATWQTVTCWHKNMSMADITWWTSPDPLHEFCTASDKCAGAGNEATVPCHLEKSAGSLYGWKGSTTQKHHSFGIGQSSALY